MPPSLRDQKSNGIPSLLDLAGVVPKKEIEEKVLHLKQEEVARRPAANVSGRGREDVAKRPAANTSTSGRAESSGARRRTAASSSGGKAATPSALRKARTVATQGRNPLVVSTSAASSSSAAGAPNSAAEWWSCPKCDFSISTSISVRKRNASKSQHIKLNHGKSKTATSGNYLSRSKMLRAVWDGVLLQTPGRLRKADLTTNKKGRIVPKRRSAHSSKVCRRNGWADNWRQWCHASAAVRREQGITGFVKVKKSGTLQGRALYLSVLERWAKEKANSMTRSLASAGSNQVVTVSTPHMIVD